MRKMVNETPLLSACVVEHWYFIGWQKNPTRRPVRKRKITVMYEAYTGKRLSEKDIET